MKNMRNMAIFTGIILISSGSVSGYDDHESGLANKYDFNRDGSITRAEYDKAFEKKMSYKLSWLDTNKDGVISPEEFRVRHRVEFDQRWSMWDTDKDDVVLVDEVLKQKQESR